MLAVDDEPVAAEHGNALVAETAVGALGADSLRPLVLALLLKHGGGDGLMQVAVPLAAGCRQERDDLGGQAAGNGYASHPRARILPADWGSTAQCSGKNSSSPRSFIAIASNWSMAGGSSRWLDGITIDNGNLDRLARVLAGCGRAWHVADGLPVDWLAVAAFGVGDSRHEDEVELAAQEGRVQAGEVVFSQKERGGGALACGLKGARDQGGVDKGRDTHPQRLDFMAGRGPGLSEQGVQAAQQAMQVRQTVTSGTARRHAQARRAWPR